MNTILVATKHVPVGGAFLRVDGDGLTREGVSHGLDPLNEVALEWALRTRDAGHATAVVAVCMGPAEATETLRRALAMGADDAVLVCDESLRGADVRTTAAALAAVTERASASLLLLGYESLDGSSGAVPSAVAALLGWPLFSRFADGELAASTLKGSRDLGSGAEIAEVDLPAVVSFVEGHVAPRYPKLKDVLRTRNARPATLTAADINVVAARGGESVVRLVEVPQQSVQTRVVGLEEGVDELLSILVGTGNGHG